MFDINIAYTGINNRIGIDSISGTTKDDIMDSMSGLSEYVYQSDNKNVFLFKNLCVERIFGLSDNLTCEEFTTRLQLVQTTLAAMNTESDVRIIISSVRRIRVEHGDLGTVIYYKQNPLLPMHIIVLGVDSSLVHDADNSFIYDADNKPVCLPNFISRSDQGINLHCLFKNAIFPIIVGNSYDEVFFSSTYIPVIKDALAAMAVGEKERGLTIGIYSVIYGQGWVDK